VLGSDAGADVSADRNLGRSSKTIRCDQVLPVHAGRVGADAAGDSVPLLPSSLSYECLHIWTARSLYDRTADLYRLRTVCRDAAFPQLLLCVCDQSADVPLPHLAAGCARRGAHGWIGNSGGRPAEDGDLRFHPLLASLLSECAD